MKFSIAHITNRKIACHDWFCDGLVKQVGSGEWPEIIFIDSVLWQDPIGRKKELLDTVAGRFKYRHEPPKPTVWQGPTRLTTQDYFAASNARNTGICLASTPYIMFVDDLSVLGPQWLSNVRHAAEGKYCVAGSYRKSFDMVVEGGELKSHRPNIQEGTGRDLGLDSRCGVGRDTGIVKVDGGLLYGCSCGFSIDTLLQVNGFDEIHDSSGAEDYSLGITLQKWGHQLWFNRNVFSCESEELHGQHPVMKRIIKPGNPDASHVILNRLKADPRPRTYGNFFELRDLRNSVLAGNPFPVPTKPSHHWFDNADLRTM